MDSILNNLFTLNINNKNNITLGKKGVEKVKKIIDKKNNLYLVQWEDFKQPTWVNHNDINPRCIEDYNNQQLINTYNSQLNININNQAYIYTRISSKNYTGVSLEVQKLTLLNWCKDNKLFIKDIKTDNGISASNMNNLTQLNELLLQLKQNQNDNNNITIVIYDISRFSRNSLQALQIIDELNKMGINIHFYTENVQYNNSSNKHLIRTALSQAQFLSESTSEKVKRSISYKKSIGKHIGGIPYGYKRVDGFLQKNIEEIKTIKEIYNIYNKEIKLSKYKSYTINKPKNIYQRILKTTQKYNIRGKTPTINTIKNLVERYKNTLSKN